MIFTLDEARDVLRVDGTDNDSQIMGLLEAISDYLKETTGYEPNGATFSPRGENRRPVHLVAMVLRRKRRH